MKTPFPAFVLILLTAAATTAVVLPVATAQSSAEAAAPPPSTIAPAPAVAPAAPLVTGLPDFTRLVEQVGPAVVNVEIYAAARGMQRGQPSLDDEQMPEFFRRFFGTPQPAPAQPQEQNPRQRRVGQGTGFIISDDGYVLTNHHVVSGADEVKVRLTDRREFTAKVVGSDQQSDVALLKIEASGLSVLRAGNASLVKPGQWALAIGAPFGLEQTVTAGIVSAVGRSNPYSDQRYVPFIQTDVAINRGNSGGPLLNIGGEVIGINSQIFSSTGGYQGVAFAIPIDVAMNVAEQLKSTGEVRRGQLGVVVEPIDAEKAKGVGLPDTLGALVQTVQPGSPAEKAGLEPTDVIRAVNGTRIRESSDLPPLIGAHAPGAKVRLGVFRDGKEREITVTLSQLDESTAMDGSPAQSRPSAAPAQSGSNPLGLVAQDLDARQRSALALGADEGVRIVRVDGEAARNAGVSPNDVILQVGRTKVGSAAALDRALRDTRPGQTVMLLVRLRTGGTQFIAVTLPAEAGK